MTRNAAYSSFRDFLADLDRRGELWRIKEEIDTLDEIGAFSYLGALLYWVLAFATKEAERQNFSPQMESFLLLVGSTARISRGVLTGLMVTKSRRKDNQ